ncbi:thiamine pyrophosphate-dependent enzyme [Paraburkholderia fungorum]|uniref:thiamine pyrophosphate-dependent enzyme n=1 Tax=Paraburkholderia fungorum TaxID=134537 RepID=UPI00344CE5E4
MASAVGRQVLPVRGGALGCGMPAAVGGSRQGGRRAVVCFIGDGAAKYSLQAL